MFRLCFIILLLWASKLCIAATNTEQDKQIDSLKQIIKNTTNDTIKINAYVAWDNLIYASNPQLDFQLNEKIKKICLNNLLKKNNQKLTKFYQGNLAFAYNSLGLIFENQSNYNNAILYHQKAILIRKKLKSKKGIADSNSNLGNANFMKGNYPAALKCHFIALKYREELKDINGVITSNINIGAIYYFQANYDDALKKYHEALKLSRTQNNLARIADCYNNIGSVYQSQKNYEAALEQFEKSLKIRKEINDYRGIAGCYTNMGVIFEIQLQFEKALKKQLESLNIRRQTDDKAGMTSSLINIASLEFKLGHVTSSKKYLTEALSISSKTGQKEFIKYIYEGLAKCDSFLKNYKNALTNYKLFIRYRDSLINEENVKKSVQTQMQYEFDKTQAADSIKNAEHTKQELIKHQQEIKQQRIYTYGGIIGFLLMLVVAIVSFRAFKNKQKANQIIAEQKQHVEEKQKEILDSIHYAKRIQTALLPTQKYISSILFRQIKK